MALYKEEGVNPFASCLPLLAQFPVFIALYRVLRYQIHPTGDKAFLWMNDIFINLDKAGTATEVAIIVIYILSMLGSTLLFSFIQDKQQKYMFAAMPFFFVLFIIRVPIGVCIYWITTNLWTIGQQFLIRRHMGHPAPPPDTSSGAANGKPGKVLKPALAAGGVAGAAKVADGAPKTPRSAPPPPPRKKKKRSGRRR
jgi:YidC/Oxa1 family membrane protein insertase